VSQGRRAGIYGGVVQLRFDVRQGTETGSRVLGKVRRAVPKLRTCCQSDLRVGLPILSTTTSGAACSPLPWWLARPYPRVDVWGFAPSEMVAIRRALEPQVATPVGRPTTETVESFHNIQSRMWSDNETRKRGKTRDKVAEFTGVSGRTLDKATAVVEAAEATATTLQYTSRRKLRAMTPRLMPSLNTPSASVTGLPLRLPSSRRWKTKPNS